MTITMQLCPGCDGPLTFPEAPELSEIVECGACGSEYEIVSVNPLMIALAPEPDEDWGE